MRGAGRYRERIVVQRYESVKQPDLSFVDTWTDILSTWCDRKMEKGSLEALISQENIVQPFTFNIRYRPDLGIRLGDRIIYRSRNFKIQNFLWDVEQTELKIFVATDNEVTV